MKKVLAILIAIVICSSLIVVTNALGEPTFTVSSCNANPGDTISVTISVSNNPGLSSLKFSVLFDSILELETVEYNSSFLGQTMQPKNLSSPVTLIWISPFSNVHTDGVFATLTFKVSLSAKAGDQANICLSYNPDDVYNIDEENVFFTVDNGSVNISGDDIEKECSHNNKVKVNKKESTCKEKGWEMFYVCEDCGDFFSSDGITAITTFPFIGFKEHTGGVATSDKLAICEICGNPYGNYLGPTFTVSNCNAYPGDTISVTISVSNNPGLSSMKFSVLFDSILELEAIEYNSSFLGQTMQPKNLSSPVTLIWISPFSNVQTDGIFATLTFKVNSSAKGGDQANICLNYNPDDVYNLDEENVDFMVVNGSINILSNTISSDLNNCLHKSMTFVGKKSSTCNERGWNSFFVCEDCGRLFSANDKLEINCIPFINYISHSPVACLKKDDLGSGYEASYYCDLCGEFLMKTHIDTTTVKLDNYYKVDNISIKSPFIRLIYKFLDFIRLLGYVLYPFV